MLSLFQWIIFSVDNYACITALWLFKPGTNTKPASSHCPSATPWASVCDRSSSVTAQFKNLWQHSKVQGNRNQLKTCADFQGSRRTAFDPNRFGKTFGATFPAKQSRRQKIKISRYLQKPCEYQFFQKNFSYSWEPWSKPANNIF